MNLNLLWKVWDLLLDNYIDPSVLNTDKMLYGAISGLVEGIGDPYSMFMTPKENTDFRESLDGILQGIGADLMQREGSIVIVAPLRGSPAEKAGLQPGDIILSVNGESPGNSLTDAVKKIRGPKGSQVILLIAREGTPEPFEVTITRDEITVPSVESAIRETDEGSVLVITVNQFGDQTVTEVESMLNDYDDGNLLGIIIDVRYNGGGYLDRAVEHRAGPHEGVVDPAGAVAHRRVTEILFRRYSNNSAEARYVLDGAALARPAGRSSR